MEETEESVFLIELDCLLDTRFAVIATFGDEAMKSAIDGGKYYERQQDRFKGIDPVEFEKRYRERDKLILKDAIRTPAVKLLQDFVEETIKTSAATPYKRVPKIEINVFPYQINDEETEILLKTFVSLTQERAHVEIVRLSHEELTPLRVKKTYSVVVMYNYVDWLEHHSKNENFRRTSCPSVTLLGPAIYFKELPTQADSLRLKEVNLPSAFRAMEITAAPFINLALVPIGAFSLSLKLA